MDLAVRDLDPSLLLTGHGRQVPEVAEHVAYALEAAERIRDSVAAGVADDPGTPYEILCRLIPEDSDLDQRQAGLAAVLSALDHLERRGDVISAVDAADVRTVRAAV